MQPRVPIRNVQQLHCLRADADKSTGMVDGTASRCRMMGEVGGVQAGGYPEEVFLMFIKIVKGGNCIEPELSMAAVTDVH